MGLNGSGKTTAFKAITNDIFYDYGTVEVFGRDTKTHFKKLRNNLGYCPQSNAIFDFLNVEEHFRYYIKLKNVLKISDMEILLEKFSLLKYRKTLAINLSGGNKRKLVAAIAIMNNPKLLMMDEPSAGVDPEARRTMWKNIMENKGVNLILATHSMEEAENLCDSIGWMKEGKFVVIGNLEQIKLEYSEGYYLEVRIALPQNSDEVFSKMQDEDMNLFKMSALEKIENLNLEQIFMRIQENKDFEELFYYEQMGEICRRLLPCCDKIKFLELENNLFRLVLEMDNNRLAQIFTTVLNLKVTL
jgi:ABC-type multidrug transport system ATPase subunit